VSAERRIIAPWLFLAGGIACALLIAAMAYAGRDYYRLPAEARPQHPRHAELRSSGTTGLACGLAGSLLMLANLTYLVRKRFIRWAWIGSLRSWMAFHVFTGLMGPALILIHTAYAPRSALGILALAAMGIAVATGLIGRFIYARVPRSLEGRELEGSELRRRLGELRSQLEGFGIGSTLLEAGDADNALPAQKGLFATLAAALGGNRAISREYRRLRREIRRRPELRPARARILPLARRYVRNRQWYKRYSELRSLMGAWRFLHRWLAIVMLAVVAFHILLAFRYGNLDFGSLLR